jgi:uncharacterized protein YbjT (DUF2867 family)
LTTGKQKRVLVTGGSTYAGMSIAAALLAEGAEVTLLVRPDTEHRLGALAQRVRWFTADIWDAASLRGRARGQGAVIHTVGSTVADPARGLTYHRLNVVSARNATNMCISDGVPHFLLLSAVYAPWVSRQYVRSKHEAESYISRVGLDVSIIRAPLTYLRGQPRSLFYRLMTLPGSVPVISWLGFNRISPMPLDMLARGVARIAMNPNRAKKLYYAPDLRRLNKRDERKGLLSNMQAQSLEPSDDSSYPFDDIDEDTTPFGWTPPRK